VHLGTPKGEELDYDKETGLITISIDKAKEMAGGNGKKNIYIKFADTSKDTPVFVPVTVKLITDVSKVKIASKVKSVVVHEGHSTDDIIAFEITPNVANFTQEWAFEKTGDLAVDLENDGDNMVRLVRKGDIENGEKATFEISSKDPQYEKIKAIKVTVSGTNKTSSVTAKLTGKLDVLDPGSALTATLTLKNTTSPIADVWLVNTVNDNDYVLPENESSNPIKPGSEMDSDNPFEIIHEPGSSTFQIKVLDESLVVPGFAYKPLVAVELENGQGPLYTKAISIKPVQTAVKGWASKKEVTLYQTMPNVGEEISFDINNPAFARFGENGMGEVTVQSASVKALKLVGSGEQTQNAFEMRRNGQDIWSLHYTEDTPAAVAKTGALKLFYTIKLEVWAEGTYRREPEGKDYDGDDIYGEAAVALCAYNRTGKASAKSKPVIVTMKVNLSRAAG
jgi:hypothetical protein